MKWPRSGQWHSVKGGAPGELWGKLSADEVEQLQNRVSAITQPKEPQNMSLATIALSSFKYRKDSGETSSRCVVVVDEGEDRVLGLEIKDGDLTEIQPYLAYEAELAEIREHLRAKYGIDQKKLPYKSFKLNGISSRTDTKLQINL